MHRGILWVGFAGLLSAACATSQGQIPAPPDLEESPHRLNLEGDLPVSEARLRKEVEEELASFYGDGDKPSIDDAAWALEGYLLRRGHPFARANYEYSGPDTEGDRGAEATIRIEAGPRTFLDRIQLDGVKSVDLERLRKSFGERRSLLGEKRYYVEDTVDSKIREIARFYRQQGFLEVEIGRPQPTFSEEKDVVDLRLEIIEGVRSYLREVQFEGVSEAFQGRLDSIIKRALNQPFTPRVAHRLRLNILALYASAAYPDATLKFHVVRDPKTGDTVILNQVEEGPEVQVGEIRIVGNVNTKPSFIRSRVRLETGDLYSEQGVNASFRELYRSRLFRRIDIRLEGEGTERDLVVEVDELSSLEAWVEPGWGSYEQARLVSGIRDRNIFGTGRSLSLEVTTAILAQKAILSLNDPWFLDSKFEMTYSLFGNRREEPSFTREELGASVDLSRQWNSQWSSSLGYQFRFTGLESDDFSTLPEELLENIDISSITLTNSRDSRDQVFFPTEGALSRVSLEWGAPAIGSQLDFFRLSYIQSAFFSLTEGTVLAAAWRGGMIAPLNDSDEIPLQERFFNGGENTVRSFAESELGPLIEGEPVGGEAFTVVNVELRQRAFDQLDGALFFDAGNLAAEARDAFDFRDLRYALGFGVRYLLPIGPLRLDFAWSPDPGAFEDDFRVHFSVGMPF